MSHPDLRLAQIVSNLHHQHRQEHDLPLDHDVFYFEDDDLENMLKEFLKSGYRE